LARILWDASVALSRLLTVGMPGLVAVQRASLTSLCRSLQGNPMRLLAVLVLALMTAACNQEQDITGSTASCPMRNYSSYNARDMNQCVSACKSCDHGNTVTCTTSCTLKGAH
jgi:hypothetical protein